MAKRKRMTSPKRILALDIGTRSIVGLIMEKGEELTVTAVEYLEHETRAMYDGQIHDVETVAAEIANIKKKLENKTGLRLRSAAVAAAGRALKTARGQVTINRAPAEEISWLEVQALELGAVQQAMQKVAEEESGGSSSGYYCVGYSIVNYVLEDQPMHSLVGQNGNQIGVEVIATFLPRVVVDSLFSALKKAGLGIASLTLEPIAAISVAIPSTMRILNLALVDIGAGTSDIALVAGGSVFAYAMVPMGGDEITEVLAEKYLLDFNAAEKVKCSLRYEENVSFCDILENQITVPSQEIINQLMPVIKELAFNIAQEILVANQKSPDAVVCVGGGSLTPNLLEEIAKALELPLNRVGTRSRETVAQVKGDFPELVGPQSITPLGIAQEALNSKPLPLIKVTINNREILLWALGKETVGSALLASGFSLNNIYGKPGLGLTLKINGHLKSFKGKIGNPPVIKVNGVPSDLNTSLQEGDRIQFQRGQDGEDAVVRIADLVERGTVLLGDNEIEVESLVLVNGSAGDPQDLVPDRAEVEIIAGQRADRILLAAGVDKELLSAHTVEYSINGAYRHLPWSPCEVIIDGKPAQLSSLVAFGSRLDYRIRQERPRLQDVVNMDTAPPEITIRLNGQDVALPTHKISVLVNGHQASLDQVIEDGVDITYKKEEYSPLVSDLLLVAGIKPQKQGDLVMRVNGVEAGFTTPIKAGDVVDLYFTDAK